MRIVRWQDGRGIWERCAFVSRPDDVIFLRVGCTRKDSISCDLRLDEVPGKPLGDFKSVTVEHRETEAYFSGTYARLGGKSEPEGYHALMRVMSNGDGRETIDGCMRIREADEITLMMRVGYLERAADRNPEKLRDSMSLLETDYGRILERHAAVHGDMFRRVTFCFGTAGRETVHAEEILARTRKEGPDTELLEVLHAVGRYALICSSGELPSALMGIWGGDWNPPWDGRYVFDSNLNLAVSAENQGAMHEAMESYFQFIERISRDWSRNAQRLYGCRDSYPS